MSRRRTASEPAPSSRSHNGLRVVVASPDFHSLFSAMPSREKLKQYTQKEFRSADEQGWKPFKKDAAAEKGLVHSNDTHDTAAKRTQSGEAAAAAATTAGVATADFPVYDQENLLQVRSAISKNPPVLSPSMHALLRTIGVSVPSGHYGATPTRGGGGGGGGFSNPSLDVAQQVSGASPQATVTQTVTVNGVSMQIPVPVNQRQHHHHFISPGGGGGSPAPGSNNSNNNAGGSSPGLPTFGTNIITGPSARKRYFTTSSFHQKILSILNKVSDDEEKFAGICSDLVSLPWASIAKPSQENSGEMRQVCMHFIDKACTEPKFVRHYARLANCIVGAPELNIGIREDANSSNSSTDEGAKSASSNSNNSSSKHQQLQQDQQQTTIGSRFKKELLSRAQTVFADYFEADLELADKLKMRRMLQNPSSAADGDEDNNTDQNNNNPYHLVGVDDEKTMTEEEREKRGAAKKRLVGIVRFASELHLSGVLSEQSINGIVNALTQPVDMVSDERDGLDLQERSYHLSEVQCEALSVLFQSCGDVFAASELGMSNGVPKCMSLALYESSWHPKPRARFLMMNVRDLLYPYASSLYPETYGNPEEQQQVQQTQAAAAAVSQVDDPAIVHSQLRHRQQQQQQQQLLPTHLADPSLSKIPPHPVSHEQQQQQNAAPSSPAPKKFSHVLLDATMQSAVERDDVSVALPAIAQQQDPIFFLHHWLMRVLKKSSFVPLRYNFGELLSRCVEARIIRLRDADAVLDRCVGTVCEEELWVDCPHLWDIWAVVVASGGNRLVEVTDVQDEYELNFDEDPRESLGRYYASLDRRASASAAASQLSPTPAPPPPQFSAPRTNSAEELLFDDDDDGADDECDQCRTAGAAGQNQLQQYQRKKRVSPSAPSPIRFFDTSAASGGASGGGGGIALGHQRCTVLVNQSWHNHMLTRVLESVFRDLEDLEEESHRLEALSVARRFIEAVARCTDSRPQSLWLAPVFVWRCRPSSSSSASSSSSTSVPPPRICAPRFRFLAVLSKFAPHGDILRFLRFVLDGSALLRNVSLEAQIFSSLLEGVHPSIGVLARHPFATSPIMPMVVFGAVVAACAALKNEKYRSLPNWLLAAVDGAKRVQREALALHELAASGSWIGGQVPFVSFGWRFLSFLRDSYILSDDVIDSVRTSFRACVPPVSAAAAAAAVEQQEQQQQQQQQQGIQQRPQGVEGGNASLLTSRWSFYSDLEVMLGPNVAHVRALQAEATKNLRNNMMMLRQ